MDKKSVIVVGGGIAGIQASIDLGSMGYKVYLVEKTAAIGGRMAQLDKTFPTNDCSICILAPKMIECVRHENVELVTYAELQDVKPDKFGGYKVKILKKPRYVDIDKCTGCEDCIAKCATKTANEFNQKIDQRKAIYIPFAQAVPRKAVIDAEICRYIINGKCGLCEKVCQAGAIDYNQKEEILELDVGAIVLATGFDLYDISAMKEYGYGSIKNVITAMQFERLICASGPTSGHLERPSDSQIPKRLAFIQCVGSRDWHNNPYCSSVCCMHATKEAILANEHYPDLKPYIFYTDMRAVGKRFQEYVQRAHAQYDVEYIRSRPSKIMEDEETKNPVIYYDDTVERKVKQMEVDMVVLCQALVPSASHKDISDILGVGLDGCGFINVPDKLFNPMDTDKDGIFACGFCQSPQDIPDSVIQASGCAARVAEYLAEVK
ncbi:MAG: CoB--CoM heterodisulfide reductase iron-sulfur subunit A family protein [Chloroflexi bacterium]|jgi:heterodisulfide reductase subunit A2|nr:CoB--CoM heterodisulfide reductase iron-sulfur subunit A family protein [Chloroflexota bacterium]MBT7080715.1 CoB--CoM heterodisulfide reductase iron-sulfur subunit A family protein [Chloroflexota bacterium]MBT7289580.1 CoB--CoM heterodisulfide reductase iron-sulfur subunit A family protein [Chloroflexota bacterium]